MQRSGNKYGSLGTKVGVRVGALRERVNQIRNEGMFWETDGNVKCVWECEGSMQGDKLSAALTIAPVKRKNTIFKGKP